MVSNFSAVEKAGSFFSVLFSFSNKISSHEMKD